MLVKKAFELIKSINNNFLLLKKSIEETKVYDKNEAFLNIANQVEKDLNEVNMEVDELISEIGDSFLTKYEVGSIRIEYSKVQPELGLAKISNNLHNLDVSFDNFFHKFRSFSEVTNRDQKLIEAMFVDIGTLIKAFNSTEVKLIKSNDFVETSHSKMLNKLVAESMDIIVKKLDSQFSDNKQKTDKMVQSFQSKFNEIEIATDNNLEALHTKASAIEGLYKATLTELEEKKEQMDEVLGHTANRVMANDYDSSAVSEKKSADWLRYGSLGCMAIIVFIVCYSFYDSTHSGFNWESSIFRTILVFILSIPAAYLSRESTKHREQQYNYHHTALDLKAITPYIASLPEADQNRIKISIAERIFASRQTNVTQPESFPLNTQDLMMELIKKIDLSKKKNEQPETETK